MSTEPDISEVEQTWSDFIRRIEAAGALLSGPTFTSDPESRAEGYRWVTQLIALALRQSLEAGSSRFPILVRHGDDITPYGATNVDNNYYRAPVEPGGIYRISGNVAGVRDLMISVQEGEFALNKFSVLGEVTLADVHVAADGAFELYLGGEPRDGNWLALTEGAAFVNIREFVCDWESDALATLLIERLDGPSVPEHFSAVTLSAGLDEAARYVEASVTFWNRYTIDNNTVGRVNELAEPQVPVGSSPNMHHGGTQWHLDSHNALILEFDECQASYFSVQTYHRDWYVPLDFANRVTSLNDQQLRVDDDSVIRIVVSESDPGVANWLDTCGFREGFVNYRYVRANPSPPRTYLVPFESLRDHLPPSTPYFDPGERRAQVLSRRRGIARRFRR